MAVELRVTVMGLKLVQSVYASGPRVVKQQLHQAMYDAAFMVEREAKQRIPQKTRGTARTIHSQVKVVDGVIVAAVGSSSKIADYIENGTGIYHVPEPHKPWTVVPKNRKALAIPVGAGTPGAMPWIATMNAPGGGYMFRTGKAPGKQAGPGLMYRTAKGGSTMNAAKAQSILLRKKVTIKGMRSRPFLRPAFEAKKPDIRRRLNQALVRSVQILSKGGGGA